MSDLFLTFLISLVLTALICVFFVLIEDHLKRKRLIAKIRRERGFTIDLSQVNVPPKVSTDVPLDEKPVGNL